MTTTAPLSPLTNPGADAAPGEHPLRRDGDLLLTGRAEFLDDVAPPGLLHAAILRSPHPHARIRSVDTTSALALPRVLVVLDGRRAAELVGPMPPFFDPAVVGCHTAEFRCLAVDKVRYVGEPVAAVVAGTLADAEAALAAIEVDYEILPPVLDVDRAVAPDAPLLFEEWGTNVVGTFPFAEGDAPARIAAAPHRVSGEVHIGRHQSAPMESRGYIGSWDRAGKLTVWASTQNPHIMRTNLAIMFGMPEDRVRVVAPRLGGGFGHKFNGYHEEPIVAALSRLAGAPVKWLETRADGLLVGAREMVHRFEAGFDDDGRVLGLRDVILGNIGSLTTWGGWSMTFPAGMTFPGPYLIRDYHVESSPVVTNKAPWNGYRGYGKEQTAVVLERIMDLIAEETGLDPAEVRRRNFIPPDAFPFWTAAKHLDSGEYASALDQVLDLAGYEDLKRRRDEALPVGRHLGIGVAFELTPEGGDFAGSFVRGFDTSTVRVSPTGAVTVLTGVTSPGTGNETSIALMVARELGVTADRVHVVQGDTDSCPYGFGSFTSRALGTGGAAAVQAAREIRERLTAAAAVLLECAPDDISFDGGFARVAGDPGRALPFAEVTETVYRRALAAPGLDQPLLEVTKVELPHNFHYLPDDKGRFSAYPSFPYSAHVALLEVDVETGVVTVLEYSVVDDCGVVISPKFVEGQLNGAIAQGIGGALWEDLPYDDGGHPRASTFKHYLTPRAPDLPTFRHGHQCTPSPFTVLGTKGVGESGVGGAMAAMTNGVNDALRPLGVRVHRLPLNPPTVLAAFLAAASQQEVTR